MTRLAFIGDTHGDFQFYKDVTDILSRKGIGSIHVGDLNIGYGLTDERLMNDIDWKLHKFIHGNHDYLYNCYNYPHFLGLFSQIVYPTPERRSIYAVGGAASLRPYKDAKEEVDDMICEKIVNNYATSGPHDYFVSHDCPDVIKNHVLALQGRSPIDSITVRLLNDLFRISRPSVWFFGHHHKEVDTVIQGTRFIGIDEKQIALLDVDKGTVRTVGLGALSFI